LRRGRSLQHEIAAPQGAAPHIDELRVRAPRSSHAIGAEKRAMRLRNRNGIDLHDVRAGGDVIEMILAVFVRDRVAAVFEIDANTRDTFELLRRATAIAFHDSAEHDRAFSEQLFAQLNRRLRGIRSKIVGTERASRVDELIAARAGRDFDGVSNLASLSGTVRTCRYSQSTPVLRNDRIF